MQLWQLLDQRVLDRVLDRVTLDQLGMLRREDCKLLLDQLLLLDFFTVGLREDLLWLAALLILLESEFGLP